MQFLKTVLYIERIAVDINYIEGIKISWNIGKNLSSYLCIQITFKLKHHFLHNIFNLLSNVYTCIYGKFPNFVRHLEEEKDLVIEITLSFEYTCLFMFR